MLLRLSAACSVVTRIDLLLLPECYSHRRCSSPVAADCSQPDLRIQIALHFVAVANDFRIGCQFAVIATYLRSAGVVLKIKSRKGSLQACPQMEEVDLNYSWKG